MDETDYLLTLFDLIGQLARRRYQVADRYFAALGLNHTEARLLTLLSQAGGTATQDALSQQLFVDRSNAGRALQHLVQSGYVERRKDAPDKRTNLVQLTTQGQTTVAEIAKLRREIAHRVFGPLTEADAGTIVPLLRRALTEDDHV